MFIPYIKQGINEYRISVLDIKNNVFTIEFMGYGSIRGIKAISLDSVFIIEEPYGMMDSRLGIVNFNDSSFYEGNYIGTATSKCELLVFERFLFAHTDGKLDIYILPEIPIGKGNTPLMLMGNIVKESTLRVYSIYTIPRDVLVEIYTLSGSRVFCMEKRIKPGTNPINIQGPLENGMFILRLNDLKSKEDHYFRFIYIK